MRISLEGRFLFVGAAIVGAGFLLAYLLLHWLELPWLALLFAFALAIGIAMLLTKWMIGSVTRRIAALHTGMLNLIDNDFGVSLVNQSNDELGRVIELYNQVTERLRSERQYLYQRELLLDTVIQNSALALVLTDSQGRIIYSNDHAKHLFNRGKPIQGLLFEEVLQGSPPVLKDLIEHGRDGLFSIEEEGEENAYHISLGRFLLNTQRHNLYLIKQMTKELNRQEVGTWKKVIRIISHELNNSLAPISSMAHSGGLMLKKQKYDSLKNVFETIEERAEHLKTFIDSYASIAKLPLPTKKPVQWREFIQKIQSSAHFTVRGSLPGEPGYFDSIQIEQVMMNLLKNAAESGSPRDAITVNVEQNGMQSVIEVCDRGSGMVKTVLENALLPYYTTKKSGSGIGLPLCREIIEAHDGELFLSNRNNGGLRVRISLPLRP